MLAGLPWACGAGGRCPELPGPGPKWGTKAKEYKLKHKRLQRHGLNLDKKLKELKAKAAFPNIETCQGRVVRHTNRYGKCVLGVTDMASRQPGCLVACLPGSFTCWSGYRF